MAASNRQVSAGDRMPPLETPQQRKIPHTDLLVSRLIYGCGGLANWDRNELQHDAIEKADRIVKLAYDNGINLFDHADVYAFGKSEFVFGEVLKRSDGLRKKIVIQSKCGIRWEDEPTRGVPRRMDYTTEYITAAVEGSLRRLSTDYLDVLLLHHPDPLMRTEEVASAFDRLRRAGKVRYFGVSNHTAHRIELLRKTVREPLVVNQLSIALARPALIDEGMESTLEFGDVAPEAESGSLAIAGSGILDYCRMHQIQVQAYSPIRGSLLNPPSDAPHAVKQTAQVLAEIAAQKNSSPSPMALAWLMHHPADISPVLGTTDPNHLIENCGATRVTLTREEWYRLFWAGASL